MKRFLIVAGLVGLVGTAASAERAPVTGVPADIAAQVTKCESCHGGGLADAPRLNGQRPDYILSRLKAFHDPASQSPHATYFMWDVASGIGTANAEALADYFGRLEPARGAGHGPLADEGRAIYQASCQSCHGPQGEGADAGPAPRLAGQNAGYLRTQLAHFAMAVRVHPVMIRNTLKLTPHEIDAVAAYLGN